MNLCVCWQKSTKAKRGKANKTNKRKSRKRKTTKGRRTKPRKHQAVWRRVAKIVNAAAHVLPQFAWRGSAFPRHFTQVKNLLVCESYYYLGIGLGNVPHNHATHIHSQQTTWSTFRKVYLTDELVEFAVTEFNHYPKILAATRQRPPFVPERYQWPPAWVNDDGRDGRMQLTKNEFLKYICILYLLGVKGLQNTSLKDLFSRDPFMREEWLCRLTNLRDIQRFLRQVCPS